MRAVLTYHSIDATGSPVSVSPEAFATHLRWLERGSVRALGLDALLAHPDDDADAVSVTFDDAFRSAREPALALLAQGIPVTLFVVTQHVGGDNSWGGHAEPGIPTMPLLGWDDLAVLMRAGASIQSHTRHHPRLSRLTPNEIDAELEGSREDVRSSLGAQTDQLAYPYGDASPVVADRAAALFTSACTTDFRFLGADEHPHLVPRLDMRYFQAPGALDAWGLPSFRRRLAWVRTRRAVRAWLTGATPAVRVS